MLAVRIELVEELGQHPEQLVRRLVEDAQAATGAAAPT
jgi:hypothetical protein